MTLGDVPTDLLLAAKAHIDALIREFALLASGAAGGATSPVPQEFSALIERVVGNFSEARQSIKKQALRAAERGEPRTQLKLFLPLAAAEAGLEYLAALEEIDSYCRSEQMLTLETPRHTSFFAPGTCRSSSRGCVGGRPRKRRPRLRSGEFRDPAAA